MTIAHARIIRDYRHGDDSRAARWLARYRRLRFSPYALRYFRKNRMAYSPAIRQLFTLAYRAVQLRRRKTSKS